MIYMNKKADELFKPNHDKSRNKRIGLWFHQYFDANRNSLKWMIKNYDIANPLISSNIEI